MNLNKIVIGLMIANFTNCSQSAQQASDSKHVAKTSLAMDIGKAAAILSRTAVSRTAKAPMVVKTKARDEKKAVEHTDQNNTKVQERDIFAIKTTLEKEALKCDNLSCKTFSEIYERTPRLKEEYLHRTLLRHVEHTFSCQPTDTNIKWKLLLPTLKIDRKVGVLASLIRNLPPINGITFNEPEGLIYVSIKRGYWFESSYMLDIATGKTVAKLRLGDDGIVEPTYSIDCASQTQKYRALAVQEQDYWRGPYEILIYENTDWKGKE